MRVFTKLFVRLSHSDQSAFVNAVIRELESCIGMHLNPEDDAKVAKEIQRIKRRAVQHGVFSNEP